MTALTYHGIINICQLLQNSFYCGSYTQLFWLYYHITDSAVIERGCFMEILELQHFYINDRKCFDFSDFNSTKK